MSLANTLNTVGIGAFGIAMPLLAREWVTIFANLEVLDREMALWLDPDLSELDNSWRSPVPGIVRSFATEGEAIGVTLVKPDGGFVSGPGVLVTVYPQAYLRLARLYAEVLEIASAERPERDRGFPVRPVPRHFFFSRPPSEIASGHIGAGERLDCLGRMTTYDQSGMPIDPLAVASAFFALMNAHQLLQERPIDDPYDVSPQLQQIADLAGDAVVRVRLSDDAGGPSDGAHLTGVTVVDSAVGLFTLNAGVGVGSDLTGSIVKEAATSEEGEFPPAERHLLIVGSSTSGRLGESFSPPALPHGLTLARDFFSVLVVRLQPFLLGTANAAYDGTKVEKRPPVRLHEPIDLLADGNDVLAAANAALSGSPQESLAVAQAMTGDFDVADTRGVDAHWPNFPTPSGEAAPAGPLPIALRDDFAPVAEYFDDGNPASANTDVILTLRGWPVDAAIRIYPRKFVDDAREARGDGAGAIVPASGVVTVLLRDPFTLRRPGLLDAAITVPLPATLRVDVVVIKRTGEARIYGNVEAEITTSTITPPPAAGGSNLFTAAGRQGICSAGVLGLGTRFIALGGDMLDVILSLAGEGPPYDAPRLPTMARRDLLVAGGSSGNWTSVIGAGRLTPEMHSADSRRGAAGSLGGRETQVVGVSTQNGRLAYDVARMAFRRTTHFYERIAALAGSVWNEPAEPASLPRGTPQNASSGTFAAAVLQTVAPFCESPVLNILKAVIDPDSTTRPTSFDALVDWVADNLVIGDVAARTLIVTALNQLKDNDSLSESTRERLFNELEREIMSSAYGRRDAQWALQAAIGRARQCIYIESPAFCATCGDYGADPVPAYAVDLLQAIAARLTAASGLHVVICTPKFPDYAAGYEAAAAHESADRRSRILALPDARVVSFHPVGFPGRLSRLETTVVIVDDRWALVGSSTFRRRGLTFDGGSDIVLTDMNLENGRSPAIAAFRRRLMATRLGVRASTTNDFGPLADPTFVRLADGVEAFHAIRERLVAGGLGTIERLWNGRLPGVPPIDPSSISMDLANPEGHEFDLPGTLALSAVATLNAF